MRHMMGFRSYRSASNSLFGNGTGVLVDVSGVGHDTPPMRQLRRYLRYRLTSFIDGCLNGFR